MADHPTSYAQLPVRHGSAIAPNTPPTHLGYSDESSWNQSRYRSLALVSGSAQAMADVESTVAILLRQSNVHELAWKNVRTARDRFAAMKVCDAVFNALHTRSVRVDVLIWDTHDSRHRVRGRDDSANLARMYYHLISNVINLRWHAGASWLLRADERTDMDWETLESCLRGRTRKQKTAAQRRLGGVLPPRTPAPPRVEEASSSTNPLVQVADMFAGLAAFSWNQSAEHRRWKEVERGARAGQQNMFAGLGLGDGSKSAQFKHEVLDHIVGLSLPGVVMKAGEQEGLRTFGPQNRLNFWHYEPQRIDDTAPRRSSA